MKKTLLLGMLLIAIMLVLFNTFGVYAVADIIVSDTTNQFFDGAVWQPAIATWVHSSWPSLSGATWIWTSFLLDSEDKFGPFVFRKTFSIPAGATGITGSIQITTDNAYNVYLNGVLLGHDGTVATPPPFHADEPNHVAQWSSIETYPFIPHTGDNEITIEANNYRGWVDPYTNPAGILYRVDILYDVGIQIVPVCGDGAVNQVGEQCDDGNNIDGDGCNSDCIFEFCGDGILQQGLGEQCDDGNFNNGDGCDAHCQLEICGDGNLDAGEQCDDGNNVDGDGCSADCITEEPIPEFTTIGAGLVLAGVGYYMYRRRHRK